MLFLAVLIAALGAALVYRYLSSQQAELDAAKQAAMGAVVEITVADVDIPIGTKVKAAQVKLVKWPRESEPVGAFYKSDDIVGKLARVTIRRNQPIVGLDLVAADTAGLLPLLIDEGMRAMSVKVDRVTGVSGFITPNSRVDVLAAADVQDGRRREQLSKLILQNIRVLATGTDIEQREEGPVEVPVVTLLVTPADAERLTLATKDDPVRLALRNYRDEAGVRTGGQSMRALFRGTRDEPKPKAAPQPVVARRVAPSMEVLLGEQMTKQAY